MTVEHRVRVRGEDMDSADGTSVIVLYDYVANRPQPLPPELIDAIRRHEEVA
jgi:hypothetical protein